MTAPRLYRCLLAALLLGAAPAWAQLTVEPQGVAVTVEQYQAETRTVTLTNDGEEPLAFCLSFDRPLQRSGATLRLGEQGGGTACGAYGGVLGIVDEEVIPDAGSWDPYGMAMTPDGRIFVADRFRFPLRTHELAPDLSFVRSFTHPQENELDNLPKTAGVSYSAYTETLWWLNLETGGGEVLRALLLEGDLDGVPTGRRIEVVPPDEPLADFRAGGLSYDPATDLFYFTGVSHGGGPANWRLWAVGREGGIPEGYPVRPEPYADGILNPPDAHGGAEGGPEGVRVEYGAYPPGAPGNDRVVVVDRWGRSEGEALETPVPAELFVGNGAGINGNPLRSRIDPNGVMYMTFTSLEQRGIVGVRPHPLPPSWLVVGSEAGPEAAWDGVLGPGESRELVLTFRAGARAVGDFAASLQAFEAATGEAVEVPLTLTVTPGVDAEEEAAPEEASRLAVYPNPARGAATVGLTLAEASEVRVAVYDVLGREVAVLHAGPLGAGEHALALDVAGLPAGLYVVRAEGGGLSAARRVTVVQ